MSADVESPAAEAPAREGAVAQVPCARGPATKLESLAAAAHAAEASAAGMLFIGTQPVIRKGLAVLVVTEEAEDTEEWNKPWSIGLVSG